MLVCLVLFVAAVLPTAFSERPEAQNVQPHPARSNEIGRRFPASYTAARNQGLLRLEEGHSPVVSDDAIPSLSDIYITLWSKNPYPIRRPVLEPESESEVLRKGGFLSPSLDQIGGGDLLRNEAILDTIGGGHLLKRNDEFRALDPIGGGHLLKRELRVRQLDAIGGGHLLKRALDAIGGGNLLKRDALDAIGGGNLLKRDALDAIGGGNLIKRYALDSIGGGNLLKREVRERLLDGIGGGHLLRRSLSGNDKDQNSDFYVKCNEPTLI